MMMMVVAIRAAGALLVASLKLSVCRLCVCAAKAEIVNGLHDRVVRYNTTVTLSCEVVGIPLPYRWWLKNGRPVS